MDVGLKCSERLDTLRGPMLESGLPCGRKPLGHPFTLGSNAKHLPMASRYQRQPLMKGIKIDNR